MGDHLGSPGVVDFLFIAFQFSKKTYDIRSFKPYSCLRPYHGEITGSRLISKVKHRRAWVVLGWVTTWEVRVLETFLLFFSLKLKYMIASFKINSCLRPYHGEITGSRLISKVKHRRAWVVLGWVTTWEVRVL